MNPIRQWCTHCIQLGEPHAVGGEWIYGGTFRSWSIQDCASILSNPVLHLEHDRYSVGFSEIQGHIPAHIDQDNRLFHCVYNCGDTEFSVTQHGATVIVPPESGVFIHSQESHSARVPEGKTAHFVSIESSEIVGRTNIMQYMRNMDRIIPRWWQLRSVLNLAS